MSHTTFSLKFYAREQKVSKKTGLCPIEISLIINGQRVFISLPIKVSPQEFNKKRKPAYIVEYCESIRKMIFEIETHIISNNLTLDANTIKDYIKQGGIVDYTLSRLLDDFLRYKKDRIGVELKQVTFKKYPVIAKLLLDVVNDIPCDNISREHTDRVVLHLKKYYENESAIGMLSKIKGIFNWGVLNNKIKCNPFTNYNIKRKKKDIEYLTEDEIEKLKSKELFNDRLSKVRDFVILQMNTGLAYVDLINLTKEDIQTNENGVYFISKKRIKSNIPYTTIILKDGLEVLKKYNWEVPKLSNQKLNSYLKELQDICNINKNLHTHIFRKTFACMLLNNGVDITSVSKALGHSNSNITQKIYATLNKETIINNISKHIQ